MKGFWGLILILAGLLFLGQSFNLLNNADMETIVGFWPLLLVLIGIWLIVKRYRFAWVIMLASLLLAGGFVYMAGFTTNSYFNRFNRNETGDSRQRTEVKDHEIKAIMEEGIKKVEAEVNTGAIRFNLEDGTENLLEGNLVSSFLDPDLETDIDEGVAKVKLDTVSFRRRFFFQDFRNELNLKFNPDLPLDLKASTGASEINFDFRKLILANLGIKAGASDIDVKFGEAIESGAKATFEVGVSNINIEVPKSIGVKIDSESGLTGEDFRGFTKKDGAYYSEGYDQASKKLEIVLRAGASSIRINRY